MLRFTLQRWPFQMRWPLKRGSTVLKQDGVSSVSLASHFSVAAL